MFASDVIVKRTWADWWPPMADGVDLFYLVRNDICFHSNVRQCCRPRTGFLFFLCTPQSLSTRKDIYIRKILYLLFIDVQKIKPKNSNHRTALFKIQILILLTFKTHFKTSHKTCINLKCLFRSIYWNTKVTFTNLSDIHIMRIKIFGRHYFMWDLDVDVVYVHL